jgi:hypothetical protein
MMGGAPDQPDAEHGHARHAMMGDMGGAAAVPSALDQTGSRQPGQADGQGHGSSGQ